VFRLPSGRISDRKNSLRFVSLSTVCVNEVFSMKTPAELVIIESILTLEVHNDR
jgi:hypothetical protein